MTSYYISSLSSKSWIAFQDFIGWGTIRQLSDPLLFILLYFPYNLNSKPWIHCPQEPHAKTSGNIKQKKANQRLGLHVHAIQTGIILLHFKMPLVLFLVKNLSSFLILIDEETLFLDNDCWWRLPPTLYSYRLSELTVIYTCNVVLSYQ